MLVKYCNVNCQTNHWSTHKTLCKLRAAELHDEALFKDPPPKEDCPICFIPMPKKLICCVSLPPATTLSVPIDDFAVANEELARKDMEEYYTCCGKSICRGCIYSFFQSGNQDKCPHCNAERRTRLDEENNVKEMMKRVEANDSGAMCELAQYYYHGRGGLIHDQERGIELLTRAAKLGSSSANSPWVSFIMKREI